MRQATLHMLCGKIAAGKSTLAARLADEHGALLVREDALTSTLWPGELTSLDTYRDRSERLKTALWPLVENVLRAGLSVVLDFPANTLHQRARLKDLVEASGVPHVLHFLDVSDEICRARLWERNAEGRHPYAPSEREFELFTSHFVPPTPAEGFHIRRWTEDA